MKVQDVELRVTNPSVQYPRTFTYSIETEDFPAEVQHLLHDTKVNGQVTLEALLELMRDKKWSAIEAIQKRYQPHLPTGGNTSSLELTLDDGSLLTVDLGRYKLDGSFDAFYALLTEKGHRSVSGGPPPGADLVKPDPGVGVRPSRPPPASDGVHLQAAAKNVSSRLGIALTMSFDDDSFEPYFQVDGRKAYDLVEPAVRYFDEFPKACADCVKELASKVKNIVFRYASAQPPKPHVTLALVAGSVLVIAVPQGADVMADMASEMGRLFPSVHRYAAAKH